MPKTVKIIGLVFAACIVAMIVVALIPDSPGIQTLQQQRADTISAQQQPIDQEQNQLKDKATDTLEYYYKNHIDELLTKLLNEGKYAEAKEAAKRLEDTDKREAFFNRIAVLKIYLKEPTTKNSWKEWSLLAENYAKTTILVQVINNPNIGWANGGKLRAAKQKSTSYAIVTEQNKKIIDKALSEFLTRERAERVINGRPVFDSWADFMNYAKKNYVLNNKL